VASFLLLSPIIESNWLQSGIADGEGAHVNMSFIRYSVLALSVILWNSFSIPALRAQTTPVESAHGTDIGWQWVEQFAGSANTDGQIMALTSSGGYNFSSHLGLVAGLPVYFVHNSASTTISATSVNGIGDFFAGLRLSFSNPAVNYRMALTGAAPSGDSSKGLSTGHATYDWTNHFDRRFSHWTPFADAGLANSVPNTVFFQQFTSLGHLVHFEGGTAVSVVGPVSASASFYDFAPWGSQQVFSRLVTKGGPPAGLGRHGRVYELNQQTTGGADLTRDDGLNLGLDARMSAFDVWAGFTHSVHFDLNVFSFGIGVNMRSLIHRARGA
jgi:hypothetical protein